VPFDLSRFTWDLLGRYSAGEVLTLAAAAVGGIQGHACFVVHQQPGRRWDEATFASSPPGLADTVAVRSALFAVCRRLSLARHSLRLDRAPDCEPIFRALAPGHADAVHAVALRNRKGDFMGALVAASTDSEAAHERLATLEAVAQVTGATLDSVSRHTLAQRDQERLQLLSETSDAALWDWDVARGSVWWGGGLELLFDGAAHVTRRPDWRAGLVHPDDVASTVASFADAVAGADSAWEREYRLIASGERIVHVRERAYFLREVDGRAYRVMGSLRDVTSLHEVLAREQQARVDAERANLVKDEFLAMLGHELRNPLAPILAVIDLLEGQSAAPVAQLQILRRQTRHMVRLVDDLLDVSRITRGMVELDRRRSTLGPLISRALEMVEPLMTQRGHTLEVDAQETLAVDVDGTRLTQVLVNLLSNSAKFTEPGGRISLSAGVEAGEAVIRIQDNGVGVEPEFLPHVFEAFTQQQQGFDRARGGLGLGLSIVRNVVQLHGGSVAMHSEGPGRGTTVVVRLPLAGPGATPPVQVAPPKHASGARDLLLVDDNEDATEPLALLLSDSGHTVRIANGPDMALALFAERAPDVALVDIGLPVMDGYELVRRLRSEQPDGTTKFIALTGYGQASDRQKAVAAGFHAHVVKPASPDQLEQLIGELTADRGR